MFSMVCTNWLAKANKGVIKLFGDGNNLEGIKRESSAVKGEWRVNSPVAVAKFLRKAVPTTGLS